MTAMQNLDFDPDALTLAEKTGSDVGHRLRRLRKRQGFTVKALAQRAGVSTGMISQIERGLSNPSLNLLERLRQALGIPLTSLLEDRPDRPAPALSGELVRRAAERPRFSVGSQGFVKELLSPNGDHALQFMLITIPPGSRTEEMLVGPGEKAGWVLEGTLTLVVAEQRREVYAGDSFQFNSALNHAVINAGAAPLKLLWIMNTQPPVVHL